MTKVFKGRLIIVSLMVGASLIMTMSPSAAKPSKEIPLLDASVLKEKPKGGGINKCLKKGSAPVYTDFVCPEGYEADGSDWQAEVNLTYGTKPQKPTKSSKSYSAGTSGQNASSPEDDTITNRLMRGALKKMAPEMDVDQIDLSNAFENGIKVLFFRDQMIDEITGD